jgi:hypothetical protein
MTKYLESNNRLVAISKRKLDYGALRKDFNVNTVSNMVSLPALHHTGCDCKVSFENHPPEWIYNSRYMGLLHPTPQPTLSGISRTLDEHMKQAKREYKCDENSCDKCNDVLYYTMAMEHKKLYACENAMYGFIGLLLADNKNTYHVGDFCSKNGKHDAVMALHTLSMYSGYINNIFIALPWNKDYVKSEYKSKMNIFNKMIKQPRSRQMYGLLYRNEERWKELKTMYGQILYFIEKFCDNGTKLCDDGAFLTTNQIAFYNAAKVAWRKDNNDEKLPEIYIRP